MSKFVLVLFVLFAVSACKSNNRIAVIDSSSASKQTCTCESNLEWIKKTFEENDAGFQHIIEKKGQEAYDNHNQLMLEKLKSTNTLTECTELLLEWLKFFRTGHIGIELLKQAQNFSQMTETWQGDISQFEKYIETKQEADYEGIWEIGDGMYKIGIKKEGENYVGFIIESTVNSWKPHMVKMKTEKNGGDVKTTFYIADHSPIESGEPLLTGKNHLDIGSQILKRLSPVFTDDPVIENYGKFRYSRNPYLDELNETTLYLRIPSFGASRKRTIDKLLVDNKDKILKTENLIIDLRNNGGGSDRSWYGLRQFLYTDTIIRFGGEFFSTELNNKQFLDYDGNLIMRILGKRIYKKLQKRMGEFVLLPMSSTVSTYQRKVVYEYPKNIGIIINRECLSATEEFLLTANQSVKVKLFGENTMGALDVSNLIFADSPCKEFRLWYCFSRSLRLPEHAIDDIGIPPDYYLGNIPDYKWVENVNEILNQ